MSIREVSPCLDRMHRLDRSQSKHNNIQDSKKTPLSKSHGIAHATQQQNTFIVNDMGVFHYFGNEEQTFICSRLDITALVRDVYSENWGRLLEFKDDDGNLHQWAMPMQYLKGNGEELYGELLRLGLRLAPGSGTRKLLMKYIMQASPIERAICVDRIGWHGQVFVLPEHSVGDSTDRILYQAEATSHDYKQSACLAEWQQHIGLRCVGNTRLVLAVSAAFAAPLLHLVGAESGGIHFVGESSTGKTTALKVAASVYGPPTYMRRWRATANGLEAVAVQRSDTLLVLDELAQVDPTQAGEACYMLANGSGKSRARKSGLAKRVQEWRLIFLSAGEVGLSQHMLHAGKKAHAGQQVRLVDLPIDADMGWGAFEHLHGIESAALFSRVLSQAAERYYGAPSIAFLKAITQSNDRSELVTRIKSNMASFLHDHVPDGASGQVARVCERFALLSAAGELASEFAITGWKRQEAARAAHVCFNAWLEQRGGIENQERQAILSHVQAFFEQHGSSRFEPISKGIPEQRVHHRVGYYRVNATGGIEYLVLPEMYRKEICAGYEPRIVTRVLMDTGMLKISSEGKPQTPQRLPCGTSKRCYYFVSTEPVTCKKK